MDEKLTALVSDLHSKVVAGNFAEHDVQSLISLVREDSPKRGPIRELGDFAAHRLRDYGPVHSYLKEVKTIIDRLGTQKDLLHIKEVFSEIEIANAFDVAMVDHGLAPLTLHRHRQLQLALISMLQGVRFKDKSGVGFGTLSVAIGRDRIELHGIVALKKNNVRAAFPVLSVANDCFPMLSEHGRVKPSSLLKVAIRDGVTVLEGVKAYEIHIGRKREMRSSAAPTPIEWVDVESAAREFGVHTIKPDSAEFEILGADSRTVTFVLREGRVTFAGNREYFEPASRIWQCALHLKSRLSARVYDDLGGYLFETVDSIKALEPAG